MGNFDYDGWKTGWYEASREVDPDAEYSEQKDVVLSATEWRDLKSSFENLIDQLYYKKEIDTEKVSEELDWMAMEFKIKKPVEAPSIERKKEKPSNLFMFVADLSRKSATL